MPKMYESPRQVVYSYLRLEELIQVASLSKRERLIVLNSNIVKENRYGGECTFNTLSINNKYSTDIAVKGLLIRIQLCSKFILHLDVCKPDDEKRFK